MVARSKNPWYGWLVVLLILQGRGIAQADRAAEPPAVSGRDQTEMHKGVHFNLERLHQIPEMFATEEFPLEGLKSFFYRGLDYQGRATRVFAFYGVPADSQEKKLPAMVLIHGGGGTAFADWVRLWNSRGYAAIAMDLCGCVPDGSHGKWRRHDLGGPPGWDASFSQLDNPIEEQWTYQAAGAVVLAHTLIRSFSEVDADRIGVTGVSWGGYLTCIVAGVDDRFRFASPVYGCGYLGDNSVWLPKLEEIGTQQAKLWLAQWDPSNYLPQAKMPMLWLNGTNDFAYPMDSWQKSYLLPAGPRTLCLRVRMPHGAPAGQNAPEVCVFAESVLRQGKPLPRIVDQGISGTEVWATFESEEPVAKAELTFTPDSGKWSERKWDVAPAEIDEAAHRIRAQIPGAAKVLYLNLFDDRDCVVSTRHVER
ncbi:MAG TPA: acetylxylan esterase [Pirellulales bacterium]|nr:acetylxylan esterase [Pirellulales bacterium]